MERVDRMPVDEVIVTDTVPLPKNGAFVSKKVRLMVDAPQLRL